MAQDKQFRLPPLKALVAFEAAARRGSFAQGADELAVTPSAISHQISQLEEFVGVRLFQRASGRTTLTPAGQSYAQALSHCFAGIAEATRLLSPQLQAGQLVIATGPSFAAKWLRPRLFEFMAMHPGIKVRLSTFSSSDDLEADKFDVAVVYGKPNPLQWEFSPLISERLRPLCSPELATESNLRYPSDLINVTLIHSTNALNWQEYFQRVSDAVVNSTKEVWIDRSSIALDAAVSGMGVVLESEILAADELASGLLVSPFGMHHFSVAATTYYLVRSPSSRRSVEANIFEKWLKETVSSADRSGAASSQA